MFVWKKGVFDQNLNIHNNNNNNNIQVTFHRNKKVAEHFRLNLLSGQTTSGGCYSYLTE